MRPVTISICSKQIVGEDSQDIQQEITGQMKFQDKNLYVISHSEDTKTLYKLSPNRLLVRRSGAIEQVQDFIPGKTLYSTYKHCGLTLNIATYTRALTFEQRTGHFLVSLEYLLYINNDLHGLTTMTITITERTEH